MTPSKGLLFISLSFLAGVFLRSFLGLSPFILYEILFLALLYALIFSKDKRILFFSFCCLIFALGIFRAQNIALTQSPTGESGHFLGIRTKLESSVVQNMPFPESAFVNALIFGNQKEIPYKWKTALNASGLRHIVSVSGSHISIIALLLTLLGSSLGFGRIKANYFAIILVWLFIILIGLPAPAVRAGIMGSCLLLAGILGKQNNSERIIFLAAFLMVLLNPSLMRYAIGFQLSFLAVLGMAYFNTFFKKNLRKLKIIKKARLDGILALTFSAQTLTFPLLLFYFGQMSLAAPLSNLLLTPILPTLMVAGFLVAVLGALFAPLAYLALFPAWLLTKYFLLITLVCSKLPFAMVGFTFHWFFLPFVYLLLFFLAFLIKKTQARVI